MIAIASILVGVVLLATWMGGWHATIFGISLSVRSVWRPLLVAVALLVAYTLRRRPSTRREIPGSLGAGDGASQISEISNNLARVVAGALLVAGMLAWTAYLSPYVGGSDSYGYVSASERLRAGTLVQREPLADVLPPDIAISATPLAYVPAPHVSNATSPSYPLGLPAQMALASVTFGPRAVFFVSIVMGVVLVATCYALAFRVTRDHTTSLAACAAIAVHPVVFAYAIQPMSDVPATAWYLLAGALLMREHVAFAPLAGFAGCAALLTRPALAPGVLALALVPAVAGGHRLARAAAFLAVVAIGAAFQAWVQSQLYGSPFANGYGSTAELFSLRFLSPNVRSYTYWIVVTHGIVWMLGAAFGIYITRDRSLRALLGASAIAAVVPYVVYRTYDHWETMRFILPFLVVMTMLAVVGIFRMLEPLARYRVHTWVALALVVYMLSTWARLLDREGVLALARQEDRYALAGDLIARVTPDDAVVLASLHSGSLRYYANRQTIDWAKLHPDQFDTAVDALRMNGYRVFLMFDGQEERLLFEKQHGTVIDRERWLPAGQRRNIRVFEAPR
jgi:hypothetical protein